MHKITKHLAVAAIVSIALTGCQSHQESQRAKVDALQKEYDQLGAQFQKDCNEEYFKVPPTLSQKCTDEKAKLDTAWKRLQEERANK